MIPGGPMAEVATLVEAGTEFEGLLAFRGTVRVEGRVTGDVVASGCLLLAEGAEVRGRVLADVVRVAGCFEGEIHARDFLELLPSARVRGSLASPRLVVAEGALFDGRCRAGPELSPPEDAEPAPDPPHPRLHPGSEASALA